MSFFHSISLFSSFSVSSLLPFFLCSCYSFPPLSTLFLSTHPYFFFYSSFLLGLLLFTLHLLLRLTFYSFSYSFFFFKVLIPTGCGFRLCLPMIKEHEHSETDANFTYKMKHKQSWHDRRFHIADVFFICRGGGTGIHIVCGCVSNSHFKSFLTTRVPLNFFWSLSLKKTFQLITCVL
jgi:hypothetical protein